MMLEDLGFDEQGEGLYVKDDIRATESLRKLGNDWQISYYDKRMGCFCSSIFLPVEVVEAMCEVQKKEERK